MAIVDYSSLLTTIASRINQSGHETAIEEAVDAATTRLTRLLRVYDQEGRASAELTTEYTALPSDFNGMRSLRTLAGDKLDYYVPEAFQLFAQVHGSSVQPIFTIEQQQLRVYPAPTAESPLDVIMLYHKKIPALTLSAATNWALDDHPDLYLAASMVEILMHLKDYQAAQTWDERTKQLATEAIVASRRSRYSSGELVIRRG